jgi:hypothetical protein
VLTGFNWLAKRVQQTNSVAIVRERTIPTERPSFIGEVTDKFADRECHVVSVTDPHSRILGFLDRSRYFFLRIAPEWTPFQTHYLSENLVAPEIEPRTSGSVARNSDGKEWGVVQ